MVQYRSSSPGEFVVYYNFPSALTYNWSLSPLIETRGEPVWTEQLLPKQDTVSESVTGVNLTREHRDSESVFVAGALIGVTGAILWDAIKKFLRMD